MAWRLDREYAYAVVRNEHFERRVYGYQIHPYDAAGLLYSCGIYVDDSVDGNVHHRCP
jgi:hypothetical protein